MKSNNKLLLAIKDIAKCIYIGFLIAAGIALIMLLFGLTFRKNIIVLIYQADFSVGSMGLFIAGISFLKPSTLRPFDHKKQWEEHFKLLNIGHVLFFIGISLYIIAIIFYNLNFSLTGNI